MRSRSAVTAALALAAATILAVAACGSSVSGSAAVNSTAAETIAATTSTTATTTDTSTESTETSDPSTELSIPSDLPTELSALLSGLPTDISLPSDFPTDISIPSDLSDLGNLNIPGYNPACLTVSLAYASIFLATYPALLGGSEAFDAGDLQKAINDLSAQVPPEIAGDIQALNEVAAEANGKTLTEVGELFNSEKFTTATNHIEAWTTANCGG
jgi:hypothetical protein